MLHTIRNIPIVQAHECTSPSVIPVLALGMALSLFLLISYVLCVLFYVLFPDLVLNHAILTLFLPGFKLLTWPSFYLGAVESFGYGWYVALIFGPLYNFFALRRNLQRVTKRG